MQQLYNLSVILLGIVVFVLLGCSNGESTKASMDERINNLHGHLGMKSVYGCENAKEALRRIPQWAVEVRKELKIVRDGGKTGPRLYHVYRDEMTPKAAREMTGYVDDFVNLFTDAAKYNIKQQCK